jgi:Polyketide cyclase / dehydrase and lipid transport
MATVVKDFIIASSPEKVWDALSDFHAVHERVAPGFLTAATRDGDDRILTFFNGLVARERLIGRDEATRRFAYTRAVSIRVASRTPL